METAHTPLTLIRMMSSLFQFQQVQEPQSYYCSRLCQYQVCLFSCILLHNSCLQKLHPSLFFLLFTALHHVLGFQFCSQKVHLSNHFFSFFMPSFNSSTLDISIDATNASSTGVSSMLCSCLNFWYSSLAFCSASA